MAKKRVNPVEARMTRADSLASMQEFGRIVHPAKQDSVRKANMPKEMGGPMGLYHKLVGALKPKKRG